MKTVQRLVTILLLTAGASLIFYACSKDNDSPDQAVPASKQQVAIYLTDDPALFDKVWVDIKSVLVKVDTCDKDWGRPGNPSWDDKCAVWDTLTIRPGVYDLLTLRNGVDTLLASGVIPQGKIRLIKIELGTNNSLEKDGVTYPLKFTNNSDKIIAINLRGHEWDRYNPDHSRIWLDFDINRSIIKVRDGVFYLRPFIKFFITSNTGSLKGKITPGDTYSVISVYNSADTGYAIPGRNGEFKVRGLIEGTYNVYVNAGNGYKDTTITGVTVTQNKEQNIGEITLKK